MKDYEIATNPDGSTVTVRDVQEYLLIMLKDIDAAMRKNNIPYFLDSGTALGASVITDSFPGMMMRISEL